MGRVSRDWAVELSDVEFARLAKLVHRTSGIVLDESRRAHITGRLAKRVSARGLSSVRAYLHLFEGDSPDATELRQLINCVTTNKTSFFREAHQFAFLHRDIQARRDAILRSNGPRRMRLWSAGCSTGEEAYSIAMTVADALGSELPSWDIRVIGTDIDTNVLAVAQKGVYSQEQMTDVPPSSRKYFQEVEGDHGHAWQVKPEIRGMISFRQLNLVADHWLISGPLDYLFCRNVTIYFDRATRETLYERFAALLREGGHLFAGHAESFSCILHHFRLLSGTIYAREASAALDETRISGTMLAAAPVDAHDHRPHDHEPRAHEQPASGVVRVARPWGSAPEFAIEAGGAYASKAPMVIKTVLGSSVAVCLFDPVLRVGGMNHFTLPGTGPEATRQRWGAQAMKHLVDQLVSLGAARDRLVAKLAGGCTLLPAHGDERSVPEQTVRFAEEYLKAHSIPVLSKLVGGTAGLEFRFRTDTGAAFACPLGEEETRRVLREGEALAERLTATGR